MFNRIKFKMVQFSSVICIFKMWQNNNLLGKLQLTSFKRIQECHALFRGWHGCKNTSHNNDSHDPQTMRRKLYRGV